MSRLFSIVIPTFNYGRFLRRAIDSAVSQKGDDFEVIVVDDGVTGFERGVPSDHGGDSARGDGGAFNYCLFNRQGLTELES